MKLTRSEKASLEEILRGVLELGKVEYRHSSYDRTDHRPLTVVEGLDLESILKKVEKAEVVCPQI